MQRPAQNVNVDGSFELGWGVMVLVSGLVPYINAALPKSLWASPWISWLGYLPIICMAFAPYAIPKLIKKFITWPRTGYVTNLNDVKLIQLVMLMGFGLALGFGLTLPFLLVSDIREAISETGSHNAMRKALLHGIQWVVCAAVVVYLGRKTIRKRQPLPAAYDASLINQGLKQTPSGRKQLRVVWSTMGLMFLGLPILLGGLVLGLVYLGKSASPHAEIHWSQVAALSFMVVSNAALYLMGNGVSIRQHAWKWLALATLLVGPVVVSFTVPYSAAKPELTPILELFPPPVTLFIGLVWLLSGAATLSSFIAHNPLPLAETP
jgi:hypothetical protein